MSAALGFHDLVDLAAEVRIVNRANGWRLVEEHDLEERMPEIRVLLATEIAEAVEGWRKNDSANVAEELADVAIRWLDALPMWRGSDLFQFPGLVEFVEGRIIAAAGDDALGNFHCLADELLRIAVALGFGGQGFFEQDAWELWCALTTAADLLEINLEEAVLAKLEKNRQRPFRHGGKRI